LHSRIARADATARRIESHGFQQSYQVSDGSIHEHSVTGIKSPVQLEDELLSIFIWVWSLKDHLKEAYRAKGLDPKRIELIANECIALQFVSDIANRAKHGVLRDSRSGKFSELVNVGYTIPQTAISKIAFGAFSVATDVANPSEVELHASIETNDGVTYDAFAVLIEAQSEWETKALSALTT
jgi:hypothetical protein